MHLLRDPIPYTDALLPFPSGLTKKDISKMLSHKELSLQRAGLQLALSLAQRLQRALREAGVNSGSSGGSASGKGRGAAGEGNAALEHAVAAAIQTHLPDFQLLVNTRARYAKGPNDPRRLMLAVLI